MSGRYQVKGLFRIYTWVCKSFRGLWVKKIEFGKEWVKKMHREGTFHLKIAH